ncbi:Formate/nitrite transporter [compost metagenome]
MLLGAEVTLTDWWLWNQIPVLIGNFIGGAFFTGFLLYWTHRMKNIGSEPSSQSKKPELQKAASVKGNSL